MKKITWIILSLPFLTFAQSKNRAMDERLVLTTTDNYTLFDVTGPIFSFDSVYYINADNYSSKITLPIKRLDTNDFFFRPLPLQVGVPKETITKKNQSSNPTMGILKLFSNNKYKIDGNYRVISFEEYGYDVSGISFIRKQIDSAFDLSNKCMSASSRYATFGGIGLPQGQLDSMKYNSLDLIEKVNTYDIDNNLVTKLKNKNFIYYPNKTIKSIDDSTNYIPSLKKFFNSYKITYERKTDSVIQQHKVLSQGLSNLFYSYILLKNKLPWVYLEFSTNYTLASFDTLTYDVDEKLLTSNRYSPTNNKNYSRIKYTYNSQNQLLKQIKVITSVITNTVDSSVTNYFYTPNGSVQKIIDTNFKRVGTNEFVNYAETKKYFYEDFIKTPISVAESVYSNQTNIALVPNPTTSDLVIAINNLENEEYTFEIVDILGRLKARFTDISKNNILNKTIYINDYPAGTYYIICKQNQNRVFTKQFIKL